MSIQRHGQTRTQTKRDHQKVLSCRGKIVHFLAPLPSSSFALLTVGFVIQFQKPIIIGVRAGIDVNIFRLNPAKRIFQNERCFEQGFVAVGMRNMQLTVSHLNLLNRDSVR